MTDRLCAFSALDATLAAVLYQFRRSHYNEKARWALDHKGIIHTRRSLLPGLHGFKMKRLSGMTSTPVLVYNRNVVAGSAQIVGFLEDMLPDARRLVPHDAAAEALGLVENLDEMLGPAVRTTIFSTLIDRLDYVASVFADDRGPFKQRMYATALATFKGSLRNATGLGNATQIATAKDETKRIMDRLATRIEHQRYLVGETFSVADLTAASLLSPVVNPDHEDVRFPEPRPPALQSLHAELAEHPMTTWVHEMYALHR